MDAESGEESEERLPDTAERLMTEVLRSKFSLEL
jgi:hypothetical protein